MDPKARIPGGKVQFAHCAISLIMQKVLTKNPFKSDFVGNSGCRRPQPWYQKSFKMKLKTKFQMKILKRSNREEPTPAENHSKLR